MIASANAFSMIGAKIKLVDVERDSLCLDKEKAKAITQNTKAVVLVSAGDDLQVTAYTLGRRAQRAEFF